MSNRLREHTVSTAIRRLMLAAGLAIVIPGVFPATAFAQLDQRDEQFYYPGDFNWKFVKNYPEGARLFNAFDYGHAVLYEKLYTTESEGTDRALEKEYQYLTTDLLIRPPRFAIVEEAVMPEYAKLAWRAKQMFDWAHILHRQIYDIYADHSLARAEQDSLIERATDYYLSREEYAFLPVPKSMALMDDQYYSQAFRKAYPKFNGLIWAYHWLQVGLYEPYIEATTPEETKAGVEATLARFWSMLGDPPSRMPSVMPMTSAVAPQFSAAHPRAAVIFDNLHMMHDIISDILQNDTVPADRKREVIYAALDEFQNPNRNVMTMDMWRNMAEHMGGVAAMGGAATNILCPIAAASHDTATAPAAAGHAGHDATAMGDSADAAAGEDHMACMRELHMRMMQDSVIRRRVMADSGMRRMMQEMMEEMSPEEHQRMHPMMHDRAPVPATPQTPADSAPHGEHDPPAAPPR